VFDQNTLDPTAILEALGLSRPTRSTPIHGGSDTLIWCVEYGSQRFALRVFQSDQATMTRREITAMDAGEKGQSTGA
jgi:hypothetical protein